jgi:8-oxo-dGTP pyrophosphatase MutT (NUDIX family)
MLSRRIFSFKSAWSRPRVAVDVREGMEKFGRRFHSSGLREAVVLALYKKPAASPVAPSPLPGEGDLVLLGKKSGKEAASTLAGKFALVGGIVERRDLGGKSNALEAYEQALRREVLEETGLPQGEYAYSYCSSFLDRQSSFLVHCFAGFLLSDPRHRAATQHSSNLAISPADGEHDSFSWIPVRRVFGSRQVSDIAKRAVDLTLTG